jgi:hypothetical protein
MVWVVLVCGVAAPVVVIGAPVVRDTLAADRGAASPTVALVEFVFTFESPDRWGEIKAERLLTGARRAAMLQLRRDYLAARAANLQPTPKVTAGRFEMADPPPATPTGSWLTSPPG